MTGVDNGHSRKLKTYSIAVLFTLIVFFNAIVEVAAYVELYAGNVLVAG